MCIVRPEQTEGPYFVDEGLNRSDIRPDPSTGVISEGIPFSLTFNVSQIGSNGCVPFEGAQVDVWHCDAHGVYSDVQGSSGTKFLRGYQVTDASGIARFQTIYPGWYQGRTVHIHFKIRNNAATAPGFDFTSQIYFDDGISDQIFAQEPYSSRSGRRTTNANDGVFRSGGEQLLVQLVPDGAGYAATFDIGLQMS
jgi:protocatechuate 3,4-dioxygenase beta subunit